MYGAAHLWVLYGVEDFFELVFLLDVFLAGVFGVFLIYFLVTLEALVVFFVYFVFGIVFTCIRKFGNK